MAGIDEIFRDRKIGGIEIGGERVWNLRMWMTLYC